jgi:Putative MetA-pathway of phenol degradation
VTSQIDDNGYSVQEGVLTELEIGELIDVLEAIKNVRVGFNGYWLQLLTDHEINGQDVPNSKERTAGLGPGIQVGGNGLWLRVNSYIETDVRNRPAGVRVPTPSPKLCPFTDLNHRGRCCYRHLAFAGCNSASIVGSLSGNRLCAD